ncbi:MAG: hemerythrin domain-containing protein [Chloroflexota bacterium]|nr:hemerythrin domain-containing protein [Chloroflexota bacterium]
MKRHPSLQSLSHDHHHGLVQARRLREAAAAEADLAVVAADFLAVWTADIQPHFRAEEETLFPAFARYGDAHLPPVVRTLLEHVEIRRQVDDLARELAAGTLTPATLEGIGTQLQAHIRYEEAVVFPLIEAALPEAALADLATRLHPVEPD